jgi:hypothetical protein
MRAERRASAAWPSGETALKSRAAPIGKASRPAASGRANQAQGFSCTHSVHINEFAIAIRSGPAFRRGQSTEREVARKPARIPLAEDDAFAFGLDEPKAGIARQGGLGLFAGPRRFIHDEPSRPKGGRPKGSGRASTPAREAPWQGSPNWRALRPTPTAHHRRTFGDGASRAG